MQALQRLGPSVVGDQVQHAAQADRKARLVEHGWVDARIENRWSGGNIERSTALATEIVALSPDVIFAYFNAQLGPLLRATRTLPIVFVGASDPVGAGYVASLPHPGGNVTDFTLYEPSLAGKWFGLLKEAAPQIARVALLINPDTAIVHGGDRLCRRRPRRPRPSLGRHARRQC